MQISLFGMCAFYPILHFSGLFRLQSLWKKKKKGGYYLCSTHLILYRNLSNSYKNFFVPLQHYSKSLQFRLVRKIKLWNMKIAGSKDLHFQVTNWEKIKNMGNLSILFKQLRSKTKFWRTKNMSFLLSPGQRSDRKSIHVSRFSSQKLKLKFDQ